MPITDSGHYAGLSVLASTPVKNWSSFTVSVPLLINSHINLRKMPSKQPF